MQFCVTCFAVVAVALTVVAAGVFTVVWCSGTRVPAVLCSACPRWAALALASALRALVLRPLRVSPVADGASTDSPLACSDIATIVQVTPFPAPSIRCAWAVAAATGFWVVPVIVCFQAEGMDHVNQGSAASHDHVQWGCLDRFRRGLSDAACSSRYYESRWCFVFVFLVFSVVLDD